MRIDQYIPGFAPHDAIGNHTLQVRRALRDAGYESDIWAEHAHGPMAKESRPYRDDTAPGGGKVLLYQASTGSPMAAWLAARVGGGERLVSNYHNITPPTHFARWEPEATANMVRARDELAQLASCTELAIAVSRYNEQELIELGYPKTVTTGLLVDLDEYHQDPDPAAVDRLRKRRGQSGASWLFVGRLAPNKCQHDIIGAFAAYRRVYDPKARCTLVGSVSAPRYLRALERMAQELELGDSLEIIPSLPFRELLAHWAVADVFVAMSEHEGFCVPLLEAMTLSVPVVAYAAAAVPETLGHAGVLLEDKDPVVAAAAAHGVVSDPARRDSLITAGQARAEELALPASRRRFLDAVERVVAP